MFNDERINLNSGKIYRKGIIYSTIISIIYLVLKAITLFRYEHLTILSFISELFIVIGGFVILIIGETRISSHEKDERYFNEKYNYYFKLSKYYLAVVLSGFALAIPIEFIKPSIIIPSNLLFSNLQILGLIYFSYYFKKNNISFNYTFIEKDGWEYYKRVLKNIIKLLVMLLVIYLTSLIIALIVSFRTYKFDILFLPIFFAFLFSFISFGLLYLYISWVEKVAYNEQNVTRKYSLVNLILGILIVILHLLYMVNSFKIYSTIMNNFSLGLDVNKLISKYVKFSDFIYFYYMIIFGYLLTCAFSSVKSFKISKIGINIFIITVLYDYLSYSIIKFILSYLDNNDLINLSIIKIFNILNSVFTIVELIGIIVLFIGLIKECIMKKTIILIPILSVAVYITGNIIDTKFSKDIWAYFFYPSRFLIFLLYIIVFIFLKRNTQINKIERTFSNDLDYIIG